MSTKDHNVPRAEELIRKLRQENAQHRKARLQAEEHVKQADKILAADAAYAAFIAALDDHGTNLERAFDYCDMTQICAAAMICGALITGEAAIDGQGREAFRKASRLQKELLPFIERYNEFISDFDNLFNSQTVQQFLQEMEAVYPLLAEAEHLRDGNIQWRNKFVEILEAKQYSLGHEGDIL